MADVTKIPVSEIYRFILLVYTIPNIHREQVEQPLTRVYHDLPKSISKYLSFQINNAA